MRPHRDILELASRRSLQGRQRVLRVLEVDEGKQQLASVARRHVHQSLAPTVREYLGQVSPAERGVDALRLHSDQCRVHAGENRRSIRTLTTLSTAPCTLTPITTGAGATPSLARRGDLVLAVVAIVAVTVSCFDVKAH